MLYLGKQGEQSDASVPDWPTRFLQLQEQTRNPYLKAFYQRGVVPGDTPLAEAPLVALDFETTGMDPAKHGIVSIGLVPFDLKRIRLADSRHWLVRPRRPLSDDSVVIHGITHQAVAEAPDLVEVFDEVLAAMAGCIAVVHYRGIERPFLDDALRVRTGEGIEFPVIDTMDLEARLHRKPVSFWNRLRGRKPESIRLAASRERYGLPFYGPHDALTDALATAELFQAQVARHFSPGTHLSQLWH